MTNKRITELDTIPSSPTGAEYFPLVQGSVTYKMSLSSFRDWTLTGINHTPHVESFTAAAVDTDLSLTGNLLAGAGDADGDPITFQTLSYNGTPEAFLDGSFQTDLGVFYLNPLTGDWTFTLGQGARKLNIGDVGHEIFTYTVTDGRGGLATSNLTISITGTNSVPVVNYVNGATPINTILNGNLIAHYAFDYESAVTVLHYTVAGITGTWTPGTPVTISGKGVISIETNGDYTFSPADGFFGPVPLITYTLTDVGSPPNLVPAYLTLAVTPLTPGSQPVLLKRDCPSCATTGGEDDKGGYLTIWGFRLGAPSGLGTTTVVKIGGVEVGAYKELVDDPWITKIPGIQRLTVQVGHLTGLTLGTPYPIVVTVSGQDSNANLIFTPNVGRILFVSLSGNDSTAVIGDINHPFRTMQYADRGQRSLYSENVGGDQNVIRGGDWSEIGYDTAWYRFRDPQQQGSNPDGSANSGWIGFVPYPGEDVHYTTPAGGNKGGIQGPGSAFSGTCGDWIYVSKLRMEVSGGSSRDAAPVNMQYNTGHWNVIGNNFGPWRQGDSDVLNAACVTGEGDFIEIELNWIHDIEGVPGVLQNHGTYAGTTSYGWDIGFNQFERCIGGSAMQFNDSDGGTGSASTSYGIWQGFTDCSVHHNWVDTTAKYGLLFADVGAGIGDLSFRAWNNVFINTPLAPMRLNTTTATSDVTYAFNTAYNCCTESSGTGNGYFRNEGNQGAGHVVRAYNNILAFGPDTIPGCQWMADYSGQSSGYDFKRNLYWANGQTPTNLADSLAIYGDPKFTDPSAKDFSLQTDSPAANAGTQALPTGFSVDDDFTVLASRKFGGAPEIGAYEIGQETPYPITPPSFSGGPRVAVSTSVNLGSWGNSPTSYSRRYTVAATAVGSANTGTGSFTYTPVAGDSGKQLNCEYTVSNSHGDTLYILAIGIVAVGAGAPSFTTPPAVTGTAQSGSTLSCSAGVTSGTVDSESYQWNHYASGVNTPVSGKTSNTDTLDNFDVGYQMTCTVTLHNSTTGNVSYTTTPGSAVLPPPADPDILQVKTFTLPANTNTPCAFDSNVANGSLLLFWTVCWDQAGYNYARSDTQGHSGTDFTNGTNYPTLSDNPQSMFFWVRSNASGAYTATFNPQSTAGAVLYMVEIENPDATTVLDIPQDHADTTTVSMALTASAAATKHNDLILVGACTHLAASTFTDDAGWTTVANQAGTFFATNLFKRKLTAVETFAFTTTIDTATNGNSSSAVIKGS